MIGRRPDAGARRRPLHRFRGWLPGALTLGNLLAGFAAIVAASEGKFLHAYALIMLAAVLDGLDGRVARLVGQTTDFGEQLDALCDAVSFAVAPAMLVYHAGVDQLERAGIALTFLYVACGVIRLARFNASLSDTKDFIGLPSPAAAATVGAPVLVLPSLPMSGIGVLLWALGLGAVALLMVSPVRYPSFKDLRFGPRPYRVLALWAALLAGLIALAEWIVPLVVLLYAGSPWLGRLLRRRRVAGRDAERDRHAG